MRKGKNAYHHGNLAESLLDAVDEIATQFGLEAVTLRACSKRVGVSPSSAFRHYTDKRALLTAFATRALQQLTDALATAKVRAEQDKGDAFSAVGLAYIRFALEANRLFSGQCGAKKPSIQAMSSMYWRPINYEHSYRVDSQIPSSIMTPIVLAHRNYWRGHQCMDWRIYLSMGR